jgi:hypothetical protein
VSNDIRNWTAHCLTLNVAAMHSPMLLGPHPSSRLQHSDLLGQALSHREVPSTRQRPGALRDHWQRVCKLILAREDVLSVSRALELALFMDVKLDVSKVPAK